MLKSISETSMGKESSKRHHTRVGLDPDAESLPHTMTSSDC